MKEKSYMFPGDKVELITGEIVTVESLWFREFVAVEKTEYIKKKLIKRVWSEDE